MLDSKRREFIALIGGGGLLLAVKVKRARGQLPAMPVIGLLGSASPDRWAGRLRAFRQGLSETGYVEGQNVVAAARTLGVRLHALHSSTERDFEDAFATLAQQGAGALLVGADPFFTSRLEQLAALAHRHALPTAYQFREFAAAGGLVSYGTNLTDTFRLVGIYTGRVLKGEKPADLPVQVATKYELIINLKTAKTLGLTVPPALLARADEVIE